MSGPRPEAPFETWPVQLYEDDIGFVWYTEPAVFVLQAVVEFGSVEVVDRFSDLIDHVLVARADAVRRAGGLFIFHDWRRLTGYDKAARGRATERMRRRQPGYARRTVIAVDPRSRLLRMAVEAVNLFAVVTLRSKLELVTNPATVLAKSVIVAPEVGSRFP